VVIWQGDSPWLSASFAGCSGGSRVGGFPRGRAGSLIHGSRGSCYDLREGELAHGQTAAPVTGPKRGRAPAAPILPLGGALSRAPFAPISPTAKPKFRPPSMAGRKPKPLAGTKPKIQSKPPSGWKA
jgi:hypothetical protein